MKLTSLPNSRALLAEGICDLMNSEMPSRFAEDFNTILKMKIKEYINAF